MTLTLGVKVTVFTSAQHKWQRKNCDFVTQSQCH